ncbi:uncharacterized protein RB166_016766 isoform 2-T2 [Leptodactylus fuscus]|uniref:uncharacterized protein LOC142217614 isoform X2 n=1 Tax=Leptodactylus fuscus TaxID=238119 RepID=UPI003F4EB7E5
MEEKELKRASENVIEEESSAKQPKLSEDVKGNLDEEDVNDNGWVDLSSECSKPQSLDTDYELDDPTMSDNWRVVTWEKKSSNLSVVTKASYPCHWIKDVLTLHIFSDYKSDGKVKKFPIIDEEYKKKISSCSCVLFCLENDKWDSETLKEVETLSSYYALKKVVILLAEGTSDNHLLGEMNAKSRFPILNFSNVQIDWYKNNLKFYKSRIEDMKNCLKGSVLWMTSCFPQSHKVGIYSRSAESEFEWLKSLLESGYLSDTVENVRSCIISNRGFEQFKTDVSNCSFGILYHTKNRGRINITDVTDSLYNVELDYMSRMLNGHVIVVVDDLQYSNDEEKSWIFQNQPSIKKKALDLFLFTTDEKKFLKPLREMRSLITGENKCTRK